MADGHFSKCEWLSGTAPLLRLLHLKVGRADVNGILTEACGLRNASWPILQILEEVRRAAKVSVICLNPSHGKRPWAMTSGRWFRTTLRFCARGYLTWKHRWPEGVPVDYADGALLSIGGLSPSRWATSMRGKKGMTRSAKAEVPELSMIMPTKLWSSFS